jgi:hypothetical protein
LQLSATSLIYIREDHTLDSRWQTDCLTTVPLAVCADAVMGRFAAGAADLCHELLAGTCTDVFAHVQSAGFESKITIFGECFSFRPQRTGTKLSTHAWGIALDLNPESNAGNRRKYGCRSGRDIQAGRIFVGRGLAGKRARSHTFSTLYGILEPFRRRARRDRRERRRKITCDSHGDR